MGIYITRAPYIIYKYKYISCTHTISGRVYLRIFTDFLWPSLTHTTHITYMHIDTHTHIHMCIHMCTLLMYRI